MRLTIHIVAGEPIDRHAVGRDCGRFAAENLLSFRQLDFIRANRDGLLDSTDGREELRGFVLGLLAALDDMEQAIGLAPATERQR